MRRAGEKESVVLGIICSADMLTTLYWVMTGQAEESNPVLGWTFAGHPVVFVITKCLACMPALILAPKLAQSHRIFTIWLLRAIIVVYVAVYFGFAKF
ncbi:MAG: DUF5658 family protein [Armatimonadota bacterium]